MDRLGSSVSRGEGVCGCMGYVLWQGLLTSTVGILAEPPCGR